MSRFREILTAIKNDLDTWTKSLPHVVFFSEFKVASSYANNQYELTAREMCHGEYHLLLSFPTMRRGVACLVSVDVAPKKPDVKVLIPDYVMSFKIFARPDLKMMTTVVGVYVVRKMPQEIAEVLDPLIQEGCIVCGDFDSTTCSHDNLNDLDESTAGNDNVWQWLRNLEGTGKIFEVFKEAWMKSQMRDTVLMTRVRHYAGSSYIDGMCVTRNLFGIFQPRDVCRSEVKLNRKFGSSHNFHAMFFHDWAIPQKPTNRFYGWGKKQIKLFTSKIREQFTYCPTNVEQGPEVVGQCYSSSLSFCPRL